MNIILLITSALISSIFNPSQPEPVSDIDVTNSIAKVISHKHELNENGDLIAGVCSGALISPDTVLTANHCFAELGADSRVEIDGESIPVTDIIEHRTEDIALARLSRPVSDPTNVIAVAGDLTRTGRGYVHYGFSGVTTPKKSYLHYIYDNEIDNPVSYNPHVNTVYGMDYNSVFKVTWYDSMGHGDSGGPLVSDGLVMGVLDAINVDDNGEVTRGYGTMTASVSDWLTENGITLVGPGA